MSTSEVSADAATNPKTRSEILGSFVETTPLLLGSCVAAIVFMWLDFNAFSNGTLPYFPPQDPRFRMWLLAYGVQASIWAAAIRLTAAPVFRLWAEQDLSQRIAASVTIVGIGVLAIPVLLARPEDVSSAMTYTTIKQQPAKLWMLLIAFVAAVIPALGIALLRGSARHGERDDPGPNRLKAILGAQEKANSWLRWVGLIIGAGTLGSGLLRRALLARAALERSPARGELFAVEEVIGYGLAFSLLLAAIYLPTAAALTSQAQRARDEVLAADKTLTPVTWLKARKEVDEAIGASGDFQKSITTGIGILGPLIGALLAQALPK